MIAPMKALSINYAALGLEALVKILELADVLQCTPREAAEAWLLHVSRKSAEQGEAAA